MGRSYKKKVSEAVNYDDMNKLLVDDMKKVIRSVIDRDVRVTAKNESQKNLIENILNKEITICTGKAGTGKTFLSLSLALGLLKSLKNNYINIYLIKSVKTLKDEEVGFLKGDLKDKYEPHIWSFMMNIEKLLPDKMISEIVNSEFIKPLPLAFARGLSIDNSIFIIDEAQNITMDNIRTIMTRIGKNSKMIILGDIKQIDLKNKRDSSLSKIVDIFEDVEEIGVVKMDDNDVNVRNPIIDIIDKKFDEYYE